LQNAVKFMQPLIRKPLKTKGFTPFYQLPASAPDKLKAVAAMVYGFWFCIKRRSRRIYYPYPHNSSGSDKEVISAGPSS
jgi:hypothetical protein